MRAGKKVKASARSVASCLAQWTTKFPQSRQQLRLDLVREELTRCAHMATVITFEHDLETLKPCALDLAERNRLNSKRSKGWARTQIKGVKWVHKSVKLGWVVSLAFKKEETFKDDFGNVYLLAHLTQPKLLRDIQAPWAQFLSTPVTLAEVIENMQRGVAALSDDLDVLLDQILVPVHVFAQARQPIRTSPLEVIDLLSDTEGEDEADHDEDDHEDDDEDDDEDHDDEDEDEDEDDHEDREQHVGQVEQVGPYKFPDSDLPSHWESDASDDGWEPDEPVDSGDDDAPLREVLAPKDVHRSIISIPKREERMGFSEDVYRRLIADREAALLNMKQELERTVKERDSNHERVDHLRQENSSLMQELKSVEADSKEERAQAQGEIQDLNFQLQDLREITNARHQEELASERSQAENALLQLTLQLNAARVEINSLRQALIKEKQGQKRKWNATMWTNSSIGRRVKGVRTKRNKPWTTNTNKTGPM